MLISNHQGDGGGWEIVDENFPWNPKSFNTLGDFQAFIDWLLNEMTNKTILIETRGEKIWTPNNVHMC